MSRAKTAQILLLAAAAASAHAEWEKEPEAVLGARLGVPIAQIGLPACPPNYHSAPTLCLATRPHPIPGYSPMLNIGGHPFDYAAISVEVDAAGVVTALNVWMKQFRFQEFSSVLIERYGAPTSRTATTVSNLAGASLPSETLTWVGRSISIVAMERAARMDESAVQIRSNSASSAGANREQRVKDAASKL